jgi:hypothetical protein
LFGFILTTDTSKAFRFAICGLRLKAGDLINSNVARGTVGEFQTDKKYTRGYFCLIA